MYLYLCTYFCAACFNIYIYRCIYTWKTELTEMATSVCSLQTEDRKNKFVFLCRQMINSNGRLLFQQMCPSVLKRHKRDISTTL